MMAKETLDGAKEKINKYINASPNPVFTEFTKVFSVLPMSLYFVPIYAPH